MHPVVPIVDWLDALWRASWQAAVLVPVILLLQSALRNRLSPAWRHALWWIVVARLALPVTPPSPWSPFNTLAAIGVRVPGLPATVAKDDQKLGQLLTAGDSLPESAWTLMHPSDSPTIHATEEVLAEDIHTASTPKNTWSIRPLRSPLWFEAAFAIWLLGFAFLWVRLGIAQQRFARRLRGLRPVADTAILAALEQARDLMGIQTRLIVLETAAVNGPAISGLLRSKLLLPSGLARRLSGEELLHVFLHELAHLRRGDLWTQWVITAVQFLHWFNPVIAWGIARMKSDREAACDALAMSVHSSMSPRSYGMTLLKLTDLVQRPAWTPGALGVVEDSNELGRRIRMITAFRRCTRWPILAPILVLALGVLFLTDAATPQNPTPSAPVQKQFEHESEPGEQGLETRVFRVNPSLILEGFESLVSSAESGALPAPDAGKQRSSPNPDPNQDSLPDRNTIAAHFLDLFEVAGISFTPPSPNRFFYNPATGVLLVRARSEDFDRIHKVLEVVNQAPPQLTIELRLVEIASLNTREIGFDWFLGNTLVSTDPSDATLSGILTGSQSHTTLLALQKRNGVKFMAAPKVTTLSGHQTRISMEADGLTATLLPVVLADGYTIDLTIDINLSRAPDGLAPDPSALHPSPTQLQISTRANIWDGQTMLVQSRPAINHGRHATDGNSKPSDRKSFVVFITPTIVDPGGNPVHSPASASYDPNRVPSGLADPSTVPPP